MTIAYYNPAAKNPLYTIESAETVLPIALEAARNIVLSQGFKNVQNYQPFDPMRDFPFAILFAHFVLSQDGESYIQTIAEEPQKIPLSRAKLMSHPVIATALEAMLAKVVEDGDFAAWWATDCTYLRGSPMAKKAMDVFGFSQAEIEQIARDCMED